MYRGDFLHGVELGEPAFDIWADQERTRFRAQYRGALEAAIGQAQESGQWSDAIGHSRRLIELAPLDEQAARLAATVLISGGRRTEARDILLQFGARLHAELGITPSPEVQSMVSRLEKLGDAPSVRATSSEAPSLLFAGREAELSQLLSLWQSVGDDSGAIALIEGEPGIGKSRLVHELAAHARSLGRATVLSARERPGSSGVPFALFVEALRPLVRASGIVGASRHLLAEASRLLPELRDTVDLPEITSIDDEAARVRFFEGVAALIDAAAYEQPVLLVLEDLHLAGPSTMDLLSYLSGRLAGSAVMFTLTCRASDASHAVMARLRSLVGSRRERARTLALVPLDRASAIRLVEESAGTRLPAEVRNRIVDRADGVPARLAELLRRALAGEDIAELPVALRSLIEERLRALSSSHRRAFLAIALLGRPLNSRVLGEIAHLSEPAVPETVRALEQVSLLYRRDGMIEAEPLAAELALAAAGPGNRAFLASWLADALAADPTTEPAELARFHAMAGRPRDAYTASRRAAFAALAIGGWPEAVQHAQVARSFAATPQELNETEGLLAALGAGNPRLAAATSGTGPAPQASSPAPDESAGTSAVAPTHESVWMRWFPNWRILFGAAVATLLISAFVMWQAPGPIDRRTADIDTLIVSEGDGRSARFAVGNLASGFRLSPAFELPDQRPALEDSAIVLGGLEEPRILDWSPDRRWVLVAAARKASASGDVDLLAIRADGTDRIPLDTTSHRSVVEAAWSPDGSRIAWVARLGDERQQEIFISFADGGGLENLTRHPADDYHLAWSGDAALLGFTSDRDGNAEIYAYSMQERRLWRLTRDPAQDDRARFSGDTRLVAFESTRGGRAGVYVMAALGGQAYLVGGGEQLSIREWTGPRRYVDRLRIEAETVPEPGDTVSLRIAAFDQFGEHIHAPVARLRVVDTAYATVVSESAGPPDVTTAANVVARRAGLVRVVADAGHWRVDTSLVRIGSASIVLAAGPPDPRQWNTLGEPPPRFDRVGVVVNGDRDWESGLLSRDVIPVAPGLSVTVRLAARFDSLAPGSTFGLALVAREQAATLDTIAPQFLRHASVSWDTDARRLVYAAGREVFTERAAIAADSAGIVIDLRVEPDSTLTVSIGGRKRWRSSLRVVGARADPLAQVWIGGRATGPLRVMDARIALATLNSP